MLSLPESLQFAPSLIWISAVILSACVLCIYIIKVRYKSDFRSIPGPWLASITDLWRLVAVVHGRFDVSLRSLHDKHGDLIRVGPNCISVADPSEIGKIYGITRLFPKSDYYKVPQSVVNGQRVASLFMITDENVHKAAKRPIAHAYAMTTLLDYEPIVDTTSVVFIERLGTLYAKTKKICNFGEWLQWYAFDVIGEMTFSRRLGFLEQGKDVGGIINILSNAGWYTAVIGQMPWLDYFLEKNPIVLRFSKSRKHEIVAFVMRFLKDRIADNEKGAAGSEDKEHDENERTDQKDFLTKFVSAAESYQGKIPVSQLLGWSISNINAGSDTTAIALRAIFYYLLRNSRTLSKLQDEIRAANLSSIPQWKETNALPYLGAVVKEAMRIHAPVGLILERIVPAGGVTVCNHFFPEGTIIGCNPAVIGFSKKVYGVKYPVDEFWPERWLEADETQRVLMERSSMAFGSGKRTCIGKNISLLEIHKLVPLLLMRFKITLAHPERSWTVWNTFFMHQKDFYVCLELL